MIGKTAFLPLGTQFTRIKQAPQTEEIVSATSSVLTTNSTEPINAIQAAQKLKKKLTTYFNIIQQNGKMKKPIKFTLLNKEYEFFVDRTNSQNYAYIKEFENSNKNDFTLFEMRFNDKNQLSNGAIYFEDSMKNKKCYRFTRGKTNTRLVNQITTFSNGYEISQKFRPAPKLPEEWILVERDSNFPKHGHYPYWNINGNTSDPIFNLFHELSKTKSTI